MNDLLRKIGALQRSDVKETIDARMGEFSALGKKSSEEQFKELCFCLLTANFSAERAIKIQAEIGDGFLSLGEKQLVRKLKNAGYRFPNTRARYIVGARKHNHSLKGKIGSFSGGQEAREWLAKNIKGLGWKESSHFLRNIGFMDVAILDFHIIDLLSRNSLCKKYKTLSEKRYLKIERMLEWLAGKTGLNLAELDLYLWYLETGKVLK